MTFGNSKHIDIKYRNIPIDRVNKYKYLVVISKTGKLKPAIQDWINKSTRAINMLQGALSFTANI